MDKNMPKLITPVTVLQESIQLALRRLSDMLGEPIQCTLICRHKSEDGTYMVFSEETNLEKVVETLQRHIRKQQAEKDKLLGFKAVAPNSVQ